MPHPAISSPASTLKSVTVAEPIWRRVWRHNKGWVFVAPAVLLWLFVGLYTVAFSIVLSFHRWNGFAQLSIFPSYVCEAPGCKYIGLKYYEELLTPGTPPSDAFGNALKNNLTIMIAGTIGVIVIALPLALAMNRATRGVTMFRSLLLLPMVTAGIAVYYVWSLIYQPEGLLNSFLRGLGLGALATPDGWLANINTALPALIIVGVWAGVPLAMLLYLAGLQTIPHELAEAAIVDGASSWQRLRHIIWPLLRPVTVIIVITSLSGALQGYEMPLLMTDGGPTNHTMVVGLLVWKKAFGGWGTPALGAASAYGWVLFILGLIFSVFSLRSMRALD